MAEDENDRVIELLEEILESAQCTVVRMNDLETRMQRLEDQL